MQISNYTALLPSNNASKPKFKALAETVTSLNLSVRNVASEMQQVFNVDCACGAQLDIIGKLVGRSRQLPFTPASGESMVDDVTYRKLLKAKIVANAWDGSNETLVGLFYTSFPSMTINVTDNQDMTMTCTIRGNFSNLELELLNAGMIVPTPAGVSATFIIPASIPTATFNINGAVLQQGTATNTIQEE